MKSLINYKKAFGWMLALLMVTAFASCKKDGLEGKKGNPVITRVRTLNKQDSVTMVHRITLDSSSTYASPTQVAFDSTTVTGKLGNNYVIVGENLATTSSIIINGVSVYFNPALMSDNSIIINIPANLPTGPTQSNTLTLVTQYGKIDYKFTVLPPAPTIASASNYNFTQGTQIRIVGQGFNSVTAVGLLNTTGTANIVSKSDTVITITMPKATVNRARLVFTYAAGTASPLQEFVNLDNAYAIFSNNNLQNSWADNSWTKPSGVSTATSKSGTASFVATYPAGSWQVEGMANWYPGIAYDPAYKFLTFWVKGGTVDKTLTVVGDKMKGGYGQVTDAKLAYNIVVPAKVWTYFKIPLAARNTTDDASKSFNFWATDTTAFQLGFFLKGQSGDVDETLYFDQILFVK